MTDTMPEVSGGSGSKDDGPVDVRKAFTFSDDYMSNRNKITWTSAGERRVEKGPEVQIYDEEAAAGYMNNLAQVPGLIDELKRDMYWAGFYGSDAPSVGGDFYDRDKDLHALFAAMDMAEQNGGQDVTDLIAEFSEVGRRRGAPMGTEVDPADDPTYQLADFAKKNGITLSDEFITKRTGAIAAGQTTLDKELVAIREKFVKPAFPAWADEIDKGMNVEDIASPYKASMSALLEIPETQIDLADPTLRSALQGVGKDGKATYKPLWMFEQEMRKDERWQYTENAHKAIDTASQNAMREMGF